ncbi:MAG: RNA-directed DNA polymerase [Terrimicrobiaceae bacterium]|nr:RNA-directed DNA polymerase [Terrimicrobiaceae bacterium]
MSLQPSTLTSSPFSLEDLVTAYRHTKAELFAEKSIPSRLDLLAYEEDLLKNLRGLMKMVNRRIGPRWRNWTDDEQFLGKILQQPKAVFTSPPTHTKNHFYVTDARERWRFHKKEKGTLAHFRTMAVPSIDFQILSMLWIMRAGHLLDQCLLPSCRGNRLKRHSDFSAEPSDGQAQFDNDGPQIFRPYYFAYRNWRKDGLKAIERELENDNRVIAVTMDLKSYYHQIDPAVLENPRFWKDVFEIELDIEQQHLTQLMTKALVAWAARAPEKTGIPVGLLASRIISNALLHDFDKAVLEKLNPVFYARYVDDILLVVRPTQAPLSSTGVIKDIKAGLGALAELKGDNMTLTLNLPYAGNSILEFSASKQRIFDFQGASGKDLLTTITREIDELSSEFRLMPDLSEEDDSVLKQALVADHDLELGADSLRKADSLTIRRLGLAILLRNHEMLERCMADPREWKSIRIPFYRLIEEHVLTPECYATYFQYLPRIFGLIAANGDWDVGERLLKRIEWVQNELAGLPKSTPSQI